VPDETHEAVRDLVRTRAMAIEDYRRKRQHVSSFLLRHGRSYEGSPTWKGLHLRWLDRQAFAHPAQRRAFQELLNAVRAAVERIGRLEAALLEVVPAWTMGSGSVSSRAKPDDTSWKTSSANAGRDQCAQAADPCNTMTLPCDSIVFYSDSTDNRRLAADHSPICDQRRSDRTPSPRVGRSISATTSAVRRCRL
jgi:hypothetical protein